MGPAELQERRVALEHEVAGLRQAVAALERGESLLPANDVALGVEDRLVRDLVVAQLPVSFDVDRFHLSLTGAEVRFLGSPLVTLHGSAFLKEQPTVSAEVDAVGSLEDIRVEPASGVLRARIGVDQIGIERAGGLAALLGGAALDELARRVQRRIEGQLPEVQIPVKVQQAVSFPAVASGPVRIAAAAMPLVVAVSGVYAGQGILWIGVRVRAGEPTRAASGGVPAAPAGPRASRPTGKPDR
jgi:hypothetical protein